MCTCEHTCTSNVKYFFKFLMIITRNGSFMPNVFFGSAGQVMNVVLQILKICETWAISTKKMKTEEQNICLTSCCNIDLILAIRILTMCLQYMFSSCMHAFIHSFIHSSNHSFIQWSWLSNTLHYINKLTLYCLFKFSISITEPT